MAASGAALGRAVLRARRGSASASGSAIVFVVGSASYRRVPRLPPTPLRSWPRLHSSSTSPAPSPHDAALQTLNAQLAEAFKGKQWASAIALAQSARELALQTYGPKHVAYASALNNAALMQKESGHADKAIPLYEQAYGIYLQAHGDDHPSTMVTRANLAVAYRITRKYDRAQVLWVAQAERYNGRAADATIATAERDRAIAGYVYATSNLIGIQLEQNNVDEAEWFAWRALTRMLELTGDNSLPSATCMNNLALVYMETHQILKARPLLEKARDVRQTQLGVDHPQVAIVQANLERLAAASAALERAAAAAAGARPMVEQADDGGGDRPAPAAFTPAPRRR